MNIHASYVHKMVDKYHGVCFGMQIRSGNLTIFPKRSFILV